MVLQAQQLWSEGVADGHLLAQARALGRTRPPSRSMSAPPTRATAGCWPAATSSATSSRPQLLVYGGERRPGAGGLEPLGADRRRGGGVWRVLRRARAVSLVAQALGLPEANSNQQRAAVGLTYTTALQPQPHRRGRIQQRRRPTATSGTCCRRPRSSRCWPRRRPCRTCRRAASGSCTPRWKDMLVRRLRHVGLPASGHADQQPHVVAGGALPLGARRTGAAVADHMPGHAGTVYYAVPQQQTVQLVLRVYL